MSVEENKAIVKKILAGEVDFDEAYSPSIRHHWSNGKPQVETYEETKEMIRSVSGTTFTIDEMMAEGDKVAVWFSSDDSHMCFIYRFSDGKIVESWNMVSIQRNGEPGGF